MQEFLKHDDRPTTSKNITRIHNSWRCNFPKFYVVIDTETSGFDPVDDDLIELSAIKVENGNVTDTFSTLIHPISETPVSESATAVNHITNDMLKDAPPAETALVKFLSFIDDFILVGYNINFDLNFINESLFKIGHEPLQNDYIDVYISARKFIEAQNGYKLQNLAAQFNITPADPHRALSDCYTTKAVFEEVEKIAKSTYIKYPEFPVEVNGCTLQYCRRSIKLIKCNKARMAEILENNESYSVNLENDEIFLTDCNDEHVAQMSKSKSAADTLHMIKAWKSKNTPVLYGIRFASGYCYLMVAFYMEDDDVIKECKSHACVLTDCAYHDAQYGIQKLSIGQRLQFDEMSSCFYYEDYKIGQLASDDFYYVSSDSKYDYGRDGRTLRLVKFAGLENGAPKVNIYYK